MEEKCFKVQVPEGYEIDKENSTFEKIVFKAVKGLPKRWEDLETVSGAYVEEGSSITEGVLYPTVTTNRNIWPTKELANASLALAQLLQLRDAYNGNRSFDWSSGDMHYGIIRYGKVICKTAGTFDSHPLCFKAEFLRDLFFENFKDLLEIAKPLL